MTDDQREELRDVLSAAIVDSGLTVHRIRLMTRNCAVHNWLSPVVDVLPNVRSLVRFGELVGVPASELLRRAGL